MRLLAYSLLLIAISAPALAGTKIDPVGPADDANLRGSVLVWHDATLYAEPSDAAPAVQLATFDVARKDRLGHVVAMKVVSGKGAFVEVELGGSEDCTSSRIVVPDDIARLRMFVRRADIAPVLVRPYTKAFADGTSITLAVGTPLVATDAGTYVVSLRGNEIEVDVPAASVGHSYGTAKARAIVMAGQTLAIAAGTKAALGERSVALTGWQGAPVERRGEATIVALDERCVNARVIIANKSLGDVDDSEIDVGNGDANDVVSLRDECYLPKLTQLMIGTRKAALAAKPIYLHAQPMGKNACIQRALKIESTFEVKATNEKLRLCAPATKVARERLRSARSAPL